MEHLGCGPLLGAFESFSFALPQFGFSDLWLVLKMLSLRFLLKVHTAMPHHH